MALATNVQKKRQDKERANRIELVGSIFAISLVFFAMYLWLFIKL